MDIFLVIILGIMAVCGISIFFLDLSIKKGEKEIKVLEEKLRKNIEEREILKKKLHRIEMAKIIAEGFLKKAKEEIEKGNFEIATLYKGWDVKEFIENYEDVSRLTLIDVIEYERKKNGRVLYI